MSKNFWWKHDLTLLCLCLMLWINIKDWIFVICIQRLLSLYRVGVLSLGIFKFFIPAFSEDSLFDFGNVAQWQQLLSIHYNLREEANFSVSYRRKQVPVIIIFRQKIKISLDRKIIFSCPENGSCCSVLITYNERWF